ncbi:Integral membrane protein 2B [Microtus ochrogaster]|uniref:Integral membrane protein 2B n=1 Tax=Microtus ochrogaster TaxID=79684 RepID=A0A8J6GWH8_MICOH|nr:Integral membrane protein 2B [Microtus ochrogaster]
MVKVTFNSALAQKESKKDEPKSSEEALIIPPDAVAVDCKVWAGVAGGVLTEGTGARAALRSRVP